MGKRPSQTKPQPPDASEIRALRLSCGWSMREASQQCEVSTSSWEAWEYGRNKMPASIWKLFRIISNDG